MFSLPTRTASGRSRIARGRALLLLAALAAASLLLPRTARANDLPRPLTGTEGSAALFDRPFFAGVYLGEEGSRTERVDGALAGFTRMVGKQPALVKTFHDLDVDFAERAWAGQLLRRVEAAGSTNYIALDLRWRGAPRGSLLSAINAGRADAHLARLARGIAGVRGTVLVSPAWEMNGNWNFHWQAAHNGGQGTPEQYRLAFRRIVDIFRREGARNVKWVFSPNVGNAYTHRATGPSHWNWYGHYYPGDGYVDYLGPHGYNGPSVWGGAYQPFGTVFDSGDADHILSDMERRWPSKKIIIGEYASQESRGHDKGQWIADAYAVLRRHRNVVGAIWFNARKEADWRIESSRSSLEAYRQAMRDPMVRSRFRA